MKKLVLSGIILLTGILLTACGSNQTETEKLQVMTSFYPMYDFTKNIVGDVGEVELLVPAGTDAHDYEPSAKKMAQLQESDVFVYNNENMETWVPDVETTLKEGDVKIIKATKDMVLLPGSEEEGHDHDHSEAGHSHELDPHVWLSPKYAAKQVAIIRDQLSEAYPEQANQFNENAEKYLAKLTDLDQAYTEKLAAATQKNFVTQHTAFSYLALDYGLNQVSISGISSTQEPTTSRLAELKSYVEDNDLKYIYFEKNASDNVARTLADETGLELLILNPLEGLTKEQTEAGEDYVSIMTENLDNLAKTINQETTSKAPEKQVEKSVYNGYFADEDVENRPLSNWSGKWQSVFPYLEDGTLDQIFDYKAKLKQDKTAEEYKEYYTTGYQTDVEKIEITKDTMKFTKADGTSEESKYQTKGYQILDYEAGNRGVRYLFEAVDKNSPYRYVQFSDHSITSSDSGHFHIYFGADSQEALLAEMDHWPTYYPEKMSGITIAQEMMAH